MSLLEDRVLRIIEMRKLGLDDLAIAQDLRLDKETINMYEATTKGAISETISSGFYNLNNIAKRVGLSVPVLTMFVSQYGIQIPSKRKTKEENIARIRQAIDNGCTFEEIVKRVDLTPSRVRYYGYLEGIKFPRTKTKEKRIKAIREAINDRAKSIEEIAQKVGLAKDTIRHYASSAGIKLPRIGDKEVKEERIQEISKLFNEGRSVDEIAQKVGLARATVIRYASESGIKLQKNTYATKRRESIDELIKQCPTLEEIGKVGGFTRERARQYLHATGQHELWKNIRRAKIEKLKREEEERQRTLRILLSALESRVSQLAKEQGWAYEKTAEYKRLNPRTTRSFDSLLKVFEAYQKVRNQGIKFSLQELADVSGIKYGSKIGGILKRVGLEPMYGKIENMTRLSQEKINALERSFSFKMSIYDIAYFSGILYTTVRQRFAKIGKREKVRPFISRFGTRKLTYRLASQIYEALDSFTQQETSELLDIPQEMVNYAVKNRKRIEPRIINALRVLYNNPNIDKPYRNNSN